MKRYFLKSKDSLKILEKFHEHTKFDYTRLFGGKPRVEVLETERFKIYIIKGKAFAIEVNTFITPTLNFSEILDTLPKVVVDMGAVPHICNGADVMVPGIVETDSFEEKTIVRVVDERHGKNIAVGVSLMSSNKILEAERGKAVKNIHYIGDRIWKFIRELKLI